MFTVQGPADWSAVLAAGSALSLFADKQIIELRIPSGKPGGKEGAAALAQLAQQAAQAQEVLTLVHLPRLDAASKTAWFTALDAHGIHIPIQPIEREQLPGWIAQRLQAQGQQVASGQAGQRNLAFFADQVEGNLLAAHQEIQKLGLLYPPGELTPEHIAQAVANVARYDVFKLSEAVLSGNLERTTRMLDGLQAEGVAEVLVHWTLAEDIRNLQRARAALDRRRALALVLRQLRIWGKKSSSLPNCCRAAARRAWPSCCWRPTRSMASSRAWRCPVGPPTAGKPCTGWRLTWCRPCKAPAKPRPSTP